MSQSLRATSGPLQDNWSLFHYIIGILGILPYNRNVTLQAFELFFAYARLYNAAASPASRLRSAGSLAINQMPRNASPARQLDLGKFNFFRFLEMHLIINSCTNMSKIYGTKGAKSCTTWRFPSYREDEIHWETCTHVWQICRVECGYCDTTRFHKNRPYKISPLISFQSVINLSGSVDGLFSQGKATTAWCRRSNGRANTRKHSTQCLHHP